MELEPFLFRQEGCLVGMRLQSESKTYDESGLRDAVDQYALRPLARDEFVVFTLDLCNNQIDRHFSRFPEEELEKINRMTPGRPLMERHDLRGTLPRGTFFRSGLHTEGERISVRPDVYVLRTQENADFILNIEGGVYRETSIAFSFRMPECSICHKDLRTCSHIPGRAYEAEARKSANGAANDSVCHYVMRDVIDVIEGSVVSSGSQGTGFVAQQRGVERATLPEALDAARKAFHRPIELWSHWLWADE